MTVSAARAGRMLAFVYLTAFWSGLTFAVVTSVAGRADLVDFGKILAAAGALGMVLQALLYVVGGGQSQNE